MLFSRKSPQGRQDPSNMTSANVPPKPPPIPAPPAPPRLGIPGGNASADGVRSQSYIDGSLTIMGDLLAQGDVQLDGRVCGNVSCMQLIVGRQAAVTGTIMAREVIVRGTVTGTIRAPVVILQEPARVESDIVYTLLAID